MTAGMRFWHPARTRSVNADNMPRRIILFFMGGSIRHDSHAVKKNLLPCGKFNRDHHRGREPVPCRNLAIAHVLPLIILIKQVQCVNLANRSARKSGDKVSCRKKPGRGRKEIRMDPKKDFVGFSVAVTYMKQYLMLEPVAKDARSAQDKIYEWEFLQKK
jgi:hypothetical protein